MDRESIKSTLKSHISTWVENRRFEASIRKAADEIRFEYEYRLGFAGMVDVPRMEAMYFAFSKWTNPDTFIKERRPMTQMVQVMFRNNGKKFATSLWGVSMVDELSGEFVNQHPIKKNKFTVKRVLFERILADLGAFCLLEQDNFKRKPVQQDAVDNRKTLISILKDPATEFIIEK